MSGSGLPAQVVGRVGVRLGGQPLTIFCVQGEAGHAGEPGDPGEDVSLESGQEQAWFNHENKDHFGLVHISEPLCLCSLFGCFCVECARPHAFSFHTGRLKLGFYVSTLGHGSLLWLSPCMSVTVSSPRSSLQAAPWSCVCNLVSRLHLSEHTLWSHLSSMMEFSWSTTSVDPHVCTLMCELYVPVVMAELPHVCGHIWASLSLCPQQPSNSCLSSLRLIPSEFPWQYFRSI